MLQKSLIRVILVFLPLFMFAPEVAAHVKWFVSTEGPVNPNFIRYSITDLAVIIWLFIGAFLVASSIYLDSRLPSLPMVESRTKTSLISILRIGTGISLLLTAYNGAIIAPHYQLNSFAGFILLALEAIIGLLLIANYFVFYAGALLLLLYYCLVKQFGFIETIEYWNMLGIAIFLIFNNIKDKELADMFKPYSVSVLRIFTGIALITLGLSEKLLSAEYGEAFVAEYHWNFVQNMGLEGFSDQLFVLSAGMMEVVFGLILVLGTTTRLNILVVSGFMLTSNITFFLEGNIPQAVTEIIGHLPIIVIAIICVFFGSGQKLKVRTLLSSTKTPDPS